MNRITPEQVVEAYRVTGLKPVREDWITLDNKCGCALTACMLHSGYSIDSINADIEQCCEPVPEEVLQLDNRYVIGFVRGFDSGDDPTIGWHDDDAKALGLGYADGTAAAKAVFGGT